MTRGSAVSSGYNENALAASCGFITAAGLNLSSNFETIKSCLTAFFQYVYQKKAGSTR